ncbi:MAG: hypothetical protein RX316_03190 [bacterium]|nr:hypothetical protein [bacterium]
MTKPKPAKTQFANESERQFAEILDFYDIQWEYEARTFPLRVDEEGNVVEAFTPDFYLPGEDIYIELTTIKQSYVTKKHKKIRKFRERYPDVKLKLLNKRDYTSLAAKYGWEPS